MTRRKENLIDVLIQAPWWASVVLSLIIFIMLKHVVPNIPFQNVYVLGIASVASQFATIAALILLIPAPIAYFNSRRKRKLLDNQKHLSTIRSLTWKEFEELVAEAYHRKGYFVVENYGIGPDGGVDLVLKKDGNVFLVQCKQWRNQKVDVRTIREMYGVMTAEQANGVIIITSGLFTLDAKSFAVDKPIDLVEGNQLVELIGITRLKKVHSPANVAEQGASQDICPDCGARLVLREARRGRHTGNKFWGCTNFPKCKFTKEYNVD